MQMVELMRIDASGVFALPDGIHFGQVQALYHNGNEISPEMGTCAIIDEQCVDVFYSDMNSQVFAAL